MLTRVDKAVLVSADRNGQHTGHPEVPLDAWEQERCNHASARPVNVDGNVQALGGLQLICETHVPPPKRLKTVRKRRRKTKSCSASGQGAPQFQLHSSTPLVESVGARCMYAGGCTHMCRGLLSPLCTYEAFNLASMRTPHGCTNVKNNGAQLKDCSRSHMHPQHAESCCRCESPSTLTRQLL